MKNSKPKKWTAVIGFDEFKALSHTVTVGTENLKAQMCPENKVGDEPRVSWNGTGGYGRYVPHNCVSLS